MAKQKDDTAEVAKFVDENFDDIKASASSAVEAEAIGADTITVDYEGHQYTVPASVEDWSIDTLEAAEKGAPTGVLRGVLGDDQYEVFKTRHPKVRNLKEMSQKVANVSGFNETGKIVAPVVRAVPTFSVLRGFLALLQLHPDLIEADLSAFHTIDYRDRWRRHPDGMRKLTLRMIYVRVRFLPAKSALSLHFSDGRSKWDLHAHLLAELVKAMAGIDYPERHAPVDESTQDDRAEKQSNREKRREAALARARAHNNARGGDVAAQVAQARANAKAI
ncbi:tail assembly chaperone [Gordonia phage DumpsterDude]|uniref:Tail assembly chaperone n=2 Tax=Gordonia phage DumpsterDude TaxID=2713262 RepID=A0A6G8R088_9CAUD|nr:tail assembly chaperone [Gordonia phage DumpsterDude]QIN93604.1 tail assembly chaperone [Gordonia phage DumpsterDude]